MPLLNPSGSIQFPSFGPSPNSSPAKVELSSTYQSVSSSQQVHRISIHLPEEYLDSSERFSQQEDERESEQILQEQSIDMFKNKNLQKKQSKESKGNEEAFTNIKVYCRLRESSKSGDSHIHYDSSMIDDGENCYSFDYVFGRNSSQEEVYKKIAIRHIDDFFMGRNSTIFAYGQTGSGKTHTMFGDMSDSNNYGIIPRALQQIFRRDLTDSSISCSMLEIYNEKLMDLFNPLTNSVADIKLKEFDDSVFLEGLNEILVENEHELLNLIRMGHKGRKTAATMTNSNSSRSHTVLFVYRNFRCKGEDFRTKICLIDLAGSEKVRKSGVRGSTLEETKKINLSLSCLGNVINSLTNSHDHIPYRNSKLTRILKDSLKSDNSTSIVTTCSLNSNDHSETISTLKFAIRAKKIKNKRKLQNNQCVTLEEEYVKLKKQLELTKKQLQYYKKRQNDDHDRILGEIPEEIGRDGPRIRSIPIQSLGVSSRVKMAQSMHIQ